MPDVYAEGIVNSKTLTKQGGSWYLLFPPELLEYLDINNPERDIIAVKCEDSKKWGRYIGVGKKGEHHAKRK